MAGDPKRVEIGFDGGQVVSVRLDDDALAQLRGAVDGGAGWHDLESEEGRFSLDLAKVVFMRGAGGSHTVGFSGS